jgi:hypothetical protein
MNTFVTLSRTAKLLPFTVVKFTARLICTLITAFNGTPVVPFTGAVFTIPVATVAASTAVRNDA